MVNASRLFIDQTTVYVSAGQRWCVRLCEYPSSPHHLLPERPCVLAGEGGLGKEVRAVSKPKGRRAHVRKGKVTARKVSDILNSIVRLVRAVGVLVDALSKWIG